MKLCMKINMSIILYHSSLSQYLEITIIVEPICYDMHMLGANILLLPK